MTNEQIEAALAVCENRYRDARFNRAFYDHVVLGCSVFSQRQGEAMSKRTQWFIICGAFQLAGVIMLTHEQTFIWVLGAWMFVNGAVGFNATIANREEKP